MKKNQRQHLILSIITTTLFLVFSTCFIYFPKQDNLFASLAFLQEEQKFYMEELSDGILLNDAYPVTDAQGMGYEPYRFRIVNNSNYDISYQIKFNNNEKKIKSLGKEVLPNKYLRYIIKEENEEYTLANTLGDDSIIYSSIIPANSKKVFEFKMWLDYNSDSNAMNKTFIGKIEITEVK